MKAPVYEIYALKYAGPFPRPAPIVRWLQDMDQTAMVNYYIFAILGGSDPVIVDCGCAPKLAQEKKLAGYVNPVEVLRRININAEKVKQVVVTHIHFDHTSGIELFSQAAVYIQEKEYNFWIKDPMAQRRPFLLTSDPVGNQYLRELEGTERLRLVRGDKKILPGIKLLLTPGHTVGLQAVAVNTAKGTAILGSDLAHTFFSYETDIPSAFITDLISWVKSYDKVRARVSSPNLLFPGHDVKMADQFPKVAEGITRLV
ncbi:MAG: N-acyl homoserine lactonase family protein [Deltaproteobacteria bacterium]|nr:N-acyl homoserine lactonase family protein [Deltaproteobacteria bacterium]